MVGNSLIGCGIINTNVDSNVFNTWLQKILISDFPQNSIIVMDNASFHKSDKTTKILSEHRNKIELLLPYSSDLTPVEFKWAQANSIRRKLRCDILNFCFPYNVIFLYCLSYTSIIVVDSEYSLNKSIHNLSKRENVAVITRMRWGKRCMRNMRIKKRRLWEKRKIWQKTFT